MVLIEVCKQWVGVPSRSGRISGISRAYLGHISRLLGGGAVGVVVEAHLGGEAEKLTQHALYVSEAELAVRQVLMNRMSKIIIISRSPRRSRACIIIRIS